MTNRVILRLIFLLALALTSERERRERGKKTLKPWIRKRICSIFPRSSELNEGLGVQHFQRAFKRGMNPFPMIYRIFRAANVVLSRFQFEDNERDRMTKRGRPRQTKKNPAAASTAEDPHFSVLMNWFSRKRKGPRGMLYTIVYYWFKKNN